jgi:hypothetical protein
METSELDIEQIIAEATPAEMQAAVCVRGDLNMQHQQLSAELSAATTVGERKRLAAEIGKVEAEMQAARHVFQFRRLPVDEWDVLRKPFLIPGTSTLDPDRVVEFVAPVVSASAVSPAMSVEQVQRLLGVLNAGQRDVLFNAAWLVNMGTIDVPFSRDASKIRGRQNSSKN